MDMPITPGTVYASRRGQRYAVRMSSPGRYGIFWCSAQSGQWYVLPGEGSYSDRTRAEAVLAELAEDLGMTDTGCVVGGAIYWEV